MQAYPKTTNNAGTLMFPKTPEEWDNCTASATLIAYAFGTNKELAGDTGSRERIRQVDFRRSLPKHSALLAEAAILRSVDLHEQAQKVEDFYQSDVSTTTFFSTEYLLGRLLGVVEGITPSYAPGENVYALTCNAIREITGNPFRYSQVKKSYNTEVLKESLRMLPEIWKNRNDDGTLEQERLNILSDSLEEAGLCQQCPSCLGAGTGYDYNGKCETCEGTGEIPSHIIDHLRNDTNHYRGCYALTQLRNYLNAAKIQLPERS